MKSNDMNYMKSYLKHVTQLEKFKYIWNNALNQVDSTLKRLDQRKAKVETAIHNQSVDYAFVDVHVNNEFQKEKSSVKTSLVWGPIIVVFLLLCYGIPLLMNANDIVKSNGSSSPKEAIMDAILNKGGWFFILIVAVVLIGYVIAVVSSVVKEKRQFSANVKNNYWENKAQSQKNTISNQIDQYKNEITVIDNKETALRQQRTEILNHLRTVQTELDKIYSLDVLPFKYRHFVAVATLLEYLETGRCTIIQGHGGIYDTYEYDLKLGAIINNLVQIRNKLDEISFNQRVLFNELKVANEHLSNIGSSVAAIEKDTATIRKDTADIKRNSAITATAAQQSAEILRWR